jgi:hypothetical protein
MILTLCAPHSCYRRLEVNPRDGFVKPGRATRCANNSRAINGSSGGRHRLFGCLGEQSPRCHHGNLVQTADPSPLHEAFSCRPQFDSGACQSSGGIGGRSSQSSHGHPLAICAQRQDFSRPTSQHMDSDDFEKPQLQDADCLC